MSALSAASSTVAIVAVPATGPNVLAGLSSRSPAASESSGTSVFTCAAPWAGRCGARWQTERVPEAHIIHRPVRPMGSDAVAVVSRRAAPWDVRTGEIGRPPQRAASQPLPSHYGIRHERVRSRPSSVTLGCEPNTANVRLLSEVEVVLCTQVIVHLTHRFTRWVQGAYCTTFGGNFFGESAC